MWCVRLRQEITRIPARYLLVLLALSGTGWLAGCGSSSSSNQNLGSVQIELSATAQDSSKAVVAPPAVVAGGTIQVDATVIDPSNQGVTWTLDPPTFGTLTGATNKSVVYHAPAAFSSASTVSIIATSVSNLTVTSTISFPSAPLKTVISLVDLSFGNTIPISDQTLSPGDQILARGQLAYAGANANPPADSTINWTLSPQLGSLSLDVHTFFTNATYAPPDTVTEPTTVTVTATADADPSAVSSFRINLLPSGGDRNTVLVNVDGGPVPGQTSPNHAYINGVTICNLGTTVCQSVDGIVIDTNSSGLRILQSAIPLLKLKTLTNSNGYTLQNCHTFPDGSFTWGSVAKADVYIGGEAASSFASLAGITLGATEVQIIGSSSTGVPDGCSGANPDVVPALPGGTNLNTPQLLEGNGILGIGVEPFDCTIAGLNHCSGTTQTPSNLYYACPKGSCLNTDVPVLAGLSQQVNQPVSLMTGANFGDPFPVGTILNLPSVPGASANVAGTLTFATSLPGATIYTLDANDHFTTVFDRQNLNGSIDSRLNALYFPASINSCTSNTQFFCPTSFTSLSAVNKGATEGESTINFSVANADSLFTQYPGFGALSNLAGPDTTAACVNGTGTCSFRWGLPFFYGRSVFTKLDSCALTDSTQTCPPLQAGYWAY